jgi:uncharacterized protein (TIGR00645 family)
LCRERLQSSPSDLCINTEVLGLLRSPFAVQGRSYRKAVVRVQNPPQAFAVTGGWLYSRSLFQSLHESPLSMERILENAMYASRWLLAPIYFGLSLGLLALALKFFQEIIHVLPNVFTLAEADLILVILSLIDMSLVGGLLVMVMISGYENFVSQLDIDESKEKLNWLGKMDSSSLKMKVAASIVAISSIHLLRVFMDAQNISTDYLMWYVIIHMTFVISAFVMGYLDRITKH